MTCQYCDKSTNDTLPHDAFASDGAPDMLKYEGLGDGEGEVVLSVILEGVAVYIPANHCIHCGAELS